jgi:hypothetical protein
LKVYLAVPLVSNRSLDRAQLMAKAIRDSGNVIASPWNLDPLEVSSPGEVNVFDRDRTGSENADVMIADVTSPSTGVGMEVMAAYKAGRRIILVSKRGRRVSRMLEDMDRKEKLEYAEESEIYEGLLKMLR